MYSNHDPGPDHVRRLRSVSSAITLVIARSEAQAIAEAPTADVIMGHRYLRQSVPHAHRVAWVQSSAGGVDHLLCPGLLSRPILFTRTPVLAPMVARHAYTMAWALLRRLPEFVIRQGSGIWDTDLTMLPLPRSALILGFGQVGRELGRLLRADGLEVLGVKRRPEPQATAFCDSLHCDDSWRDLLPKADLCFLALPLNRATKGIFDESALLGLPRHAVLINIGRGGTLDNRALYRVLQRGHLGGVGLDAVDPESLGAANPLWRAPRLLLTPHVAAHWPDRWRAIEEFFEIQLGRFVGGEPLDGVVNPLDLLL